MHPDGRDQRDGFALLEVLIAFAIASIALGVLYSGAAEGLLGSRLAARTDEATTRARSRLALMCHGARLTPGEQSGDAGGGFSWRVHTARAATEMLDRGEANTSAPPERADSNHVRVIVSWPGTVRRHEVALETRCLAVGPADRP